MTSRSEGPVLARVGEGMIARRLVVRAPDVAFLKGIVEAHEGLAQVYAERGGDLLIASTAGRERELDQLVLDLAREFDGILSPLPPAETP
jgi:hypothetical protein